MVVIVLTVAVVVVLVVLIVVTTSSWYDRGDGGKSKVKEWLETNSCLFVADDDEAFPTS